MCKELIAPLYECVTEFLEHHSIQSIYHEYPETLVQDRDSAQWFNEMYCTCNVQFWQLDAITKREATFYKQTLAQVHCLTACLVSDEHERNINSGQQQICNLVEK